MAKNTGKGSRAAAEQNRRESDYTPSVAEFRISYRVTHADLDSTESIERADAAFERGIEQVRADERTKRPDLPCDRGCNVNDGPMEDCSQHGRSPRDLWGIIEDLSQRLAAERAKRPDREQIAHAVKQGLSQYDAYWPDSEDDPTGAEHFITDAVLSSFGRTTGRST